MQESKELDILDLIGAVWQRKTFVIAIGFAVALVALVVSLLLPKAYLSSSEILVVRPVASNEGMGRAHEVPFKTFETVIENWQNLVQTIELLNLRVEDKKMLPEQLDGNIKVRVLPDIDIVQVDVWMPDPNMAQKVNGHLVELALRRYSGFTVTETAEAASQLDSMAKDAEEEFKKLNTRFRDFTVEARLMQLHEHLEVLAQAMKEVSQRLHVSIGMKALAQAQVATFGQTLSKRSPNVELEAHYQLAPELASSLFGKPISAPAQVSVGQQIQNPTYLRADSELVVAQADMDGEDSQIKALKQRLGELDEDFVATEKLFNERTAEKRMLESELTARQTAYESIYKKRAEAAMNVSTRSYALRVLSSPSFSDRKASPKTTLNVLGGALLGFLASTVWVLADSYRRRRQS